MVGCVFSAASLSLWAAEKASTRTAPKTPPKSASIAQNPYRGAIVIDVATGAVLVQDNPDVRAYPASVLKLMDLLIVLEKLQQKQLNLQDQVTVSPKASKTGGSQVWLADKEVFTVDELLYALMVQSANDAAVALAEKVGGTTDGFVELMNKKARELGMTSTVFHSVHGLPPAPGQEPDVTTPRDLSLLCRELMKYPDTLRYTSTRERPFRPNGGSRTVVMRTHNHVMANFEGCDGLKTGFYSVAGYSIATTAYRNGRRVIAVILGSQDRKVRDAKAAELMSKGFSAPLPAPTIATPTAPTVTQTNKKPATPGKLNVQ